MPLLCETQYRRLKVRRNGKIYLQTERVRVETEPVPVDPLAACLGDRIGVAAVDPASDAWGKDPVDPLPKAAACQEVNAEATRPA